MPTSNPVGATENLLNKKVYGAVQVGTAAVNGGSAVVGAANREAEDCLRTHGHRRELQREFERRPNLHRTYERGQSLVVVR